MLYWQDMFMNGYHQECSEVKQYHTSSLAFIILTTDKEVNKV